MITLRLTPQVLWFTNLRLSIFLHYLINVLIRVAKAGIVRWVTTKYNPGLLAHFCFCECQ